MHFSTPATQAAGTTDFSKLDKQGASALSSLSSMLTLPPLLQALQPLSSFVTQCERPPVLQALQVSGLAAHFVSLYTPPRLARHR